jgi:hypothetical protein
LSDGSIDGRFDARGRPVIDLPLKNLEDPLLYEHQARLAGLDVEPRKTAKASRVGQDGETVLLETSSRVDWMGQERIVLIHIIPGPVPPGELPAIGTELLRDCRLEIDFPNRSLRISRS